MKVKFWYIAFLLLAPLPTLCISSIIPYFSTDVFVQASIAIFLAGAATAWLFVLQKKFVVFQAVAIFVISTLAACVFLPPVPSAAKLDIFCATLALLNFSLGALGRTIADKTTVSAEKRKWLIVARIFWFIGILHLGSLNSLHLTVLKEHKILCIQLYVLVEALFFIKAKTQDLS